MGPRPTPHLRYVPESTKSSTEVQVKCNQLLLVYHSGAALVYGKPYLVASIDVLERQFSRSVQTLNFVYAISDIVEKLVEAILFNDLSRGVKDEHRIRPDIMVNLPLVIKLCPIKMNGTYVYGDYVRPIQFFQKVCPSHYLPASPVGDHWQGEVHIALVELARGDRLVSDAFLFLAQLDELAE